MSFSSGYNISIVSIVPSIPFITSRRLTMGRSVLRVGGGEVVTTPTNTV